ncbi:hypothetical protein [Candidatus Vondammii sp. HM_W22]|uniref:hypothetical protein n=1 Tax=Candidatus Vondammii sp. HM_W22 TaxID=2687299 RepID=UPI002E7B81FF|nr:hypothetical protein [Candidatus Vondammii sp. HM_W22]
MKNQLSIDFNPDIYGQYDTCREFILEDDVPRVCRENRVLNKAIAADEGHRFTLDDLELFMQKTGSIEPVKYLISKYLYKQSPDEIQKQIDELERLKAEMQG